MRAKLCNHIMDWLMDCQVTQVSYDQGGIFDPLDQRVIGDHYATTHFAWASALQYSRQPLPHWLKKAEKAIGFHLRTSQEEYPPGHWDYHWDFNNLAFVETYALLADHLSTAEKQRWKTHLLQWKSNPHSAVNWVAMRALALFKRGVLLNRPTDIKAAKGLVDTILSGQTRDGCFDDLPGRSRPSQYHAYTACLLLQMQQIDPDRILRSCKRAARWLFQVTAPDGDINTLGRGQGQIFGYACAIYLFRAAANLDSRFCAHYLWAENKLLEKLSLALQPEGYLPLVINDCGGDPPCGWYDYHHLTVYNAFALVWLMLSQTQVSPEKKRLPTSLSKSNPPVLESSFLPDSGIVCVHGPNFSLLCTAGESGAGYATDVGISPHFVFWKQKLLFRYPVGPGPGKYGTRAQDHRQEENIWSPLICVGGQWLAPFQGKGEIKPLGGKGCRGCLMTYSRNNVVWERRILVGEFHMEVWDFLDLTRTDLEIDRVRTVNIALEKGLVKDRGESFLVLSDVILNAWGQGDGLVHRGTARGATGVVDLYAMETRPDHCRKFHSGFRLRMPGGKKAGVLPGIVCTSWDPWTQLWKRKQRLLFNIAQDDSGPVVLYSEPPVPLTAIVEGVFVPKKSKEKSQRFRRSLSGRLIPKGKKFFLFTPLIPLPGGRSLKWIQAANIKIMGHLLKRKIKKIGFSNYILWLYHPSQIWVLDSLGPGAGLIVYDWTDDWVEAFPSHLPCEQKADLENKQKQLLKRCDLVFGVSKQLCKRAEKFCANVHYLPNATDPTVFKPALAEDLPHPLLVSIAGPCLVYLSQMTKRLDRDLLVDLAARQPKWQILMIGPVICPESYLLPLGAMENIHFMGSLPYDTAAKIVAQSDVCILPHKVDALTRSLDPIKLYDYLATGRPVVTTPVAMHEEIKPYVSIASTAAGFETAILNALKESGTKALERRKAAMSHIWDKRKDAALSILRKRF